MTSIRASQVDKIDAAYRALSEAREGSSRDSELHADDELNAIVRDSSPDEIRAWAARANGRAAGEVSRA